jgi:hypothetical protein
MRRNLIKLALIAVLVAVSVTMFTGLLFPNEIRNKLTGLMWNQALFVYRSDADLGSELAQMPRRLIRRPELPQLVLDIKFKHLMRLYGEREDALGKGILLQKEDSLVPAKARIGDETVPIKLRLKGDWIDHLHGKKWSFRIQVKGDNEIFGLRRFSIQHPRTRGYQGEILFLETLRRYGILAPRYFFARVQINGNHLGVMAVEEHFSKELLEHNHRKEGVIVKFDEAPLWEARANPNNAKSTDAIYNAFETAAIDSFRSSKVARSPYLSEQYAVAVGLLRAFADEEQTASEIFDVEKTGTFLAVIQAWRALHSAADHNMRFYLNPFTARLEPIGFDASLDFPISEDLEFIPNIGLTKKLLADPKIFAAFQAGLARIETDLRSQDLMQHLAKVQDDAVGILRSEFSLLQPIDLTTLIENIAAGRNMTYQRLQQADPSSFPNVDVSPDNYTSLIKAYFIPAGHQGARLEVVNIVPERLELTEVRWIRMSDDQSETATLVDLDYPVAIAPTVIGAVPTKSTIELPATQDGSSGYFEVVASVPGSTKTQTARSIRSYTAADARLAHQTATIAQQLEAHPFLELDRQTQIITIRPGDWRVAETLVVPQGYRLEITEGTVLRFAEEAALVAYGDVRLVGSPDNPIRLMADDEATPTAATWPGVVVFQAPAPSRWSHVTVEQTRGVPWVGWTLTGGVTFYESDVSIDTSLFRDNRGEDALNIISSKFTLTDVDFQNTASDAFDSDFSNGQVTGGMYANIGRVGTGGDAIDTSGSEIVIEGTRFDTVSDKAISVGERSRARISGVTVARATSGVVSKDGSLVEIDRSAIDGSSLAGLMAYTKKAEYGTARLVADRVDITGSQSPALAQNGSTVRWNGRKVATDAIDVDALYDTATKP